MNTKLFFIATCLFAANTLSAKITLPHVLGDNMVLQQQSTVKLWGEATPNKKVVVETSWLKKKVSCNSDADGKWMVQIPTPEGSYEPQTIEISDGEAIQLKNILIGEVWLASGQSNMEMPLIGFWHCPVEGANEEILHSGKYHDRIRFVKIPKVQAFEPKDDVDCRWVESNPQNSPHFSAVAYFFAKSLTGVLDVPVGIIDCNWGGSPVESWLDKNTLQGYGDVNLDETAINQIGEPGRPMMMYNAMLHPMKNFTLRGFIWYQGEANVGRYPVYAERLADMVKLWRNDWNLGDLPFYYVEIAPYDYGQGRTDFAAYLREAQYKAQSLIPNSGMVSTNDLVFDYERVNIHPAKKKEVGQRLSYMALSYTYGVKGVHAHGPEYSSVEFKDGEAFVKFKYADMGFNRLIDIKGFEICGADKQFYPAEARISGNTVIVKSDKVQQPVSVRYCFRDFMVGNLAGTFGLPVVPFRTDNF